jgi:hypothetical protein
LGYLLAQREEQNHMAFLKRSVSVTAPKPAAFPNATSSKLVVGEEHGGLVWDGDSWVPKHVWEARAKKD